MKIGGLTLARIDRVGVKQDVREWHWEQIWNAYFLDINCCFNFL